MIDIDKAFKNAILADAAYVAGLAFTSTFEQLKTALSERMTPTLAEYIAKRFSVVTQTESVLGSFDATIWRANNEDGQPNPNGKLYVSMRGTQQAADFITDVDLAATGNARIELVEMVNWWLRISTPVGQQAKQIMTVGLVYLAATSVPGEGLVSAADLAAGVEVNGHSLGGYLASAFTRLFGNQAHVTHTSTFNSAGFAPGSEAVFTELQNLIGVSYGLGRYPNGQEQSNYFSNNGLNVTTNSFYFNQQGQRIELFQEEGLGLANHYIYKQTDLLALGAALEQLDSSITFAKLNDFIKAGSNDMKASYEGLLDGLRKIVLGTTSFTATQIGDVGADNAPNRTDYHTNLKALTDSEAFKALAGKVTLTLATSVNLVAQAKTDFAAFLALHALSPVVIATSDATAIAKLKQANETLAQQWASRSKASNQSVFKSAA